MENVKKAMLKYYAERDKTVPTIARYSRNLNALYLSGKLDPCYHREETIAQLQRILLRKNKANVLLTGIAGCGKTAIVEGLAAVIAERKMAYEEAAMAARKAHDGEVKAWEEANSGGPCPKYTEPPEPLLCNCVVYDLSLTALVGGTKYRGEFEERLQEVVQECRKNPNVVLFMDEFHMVTVTGASESSFGAAQMLKPALARKDMRLIGATTTEEAEEILEDGAFARRFSKVPVMPLAGDAAVQTARNILANYCKFHKIKTKVSADDLLAQVRYFLPGTVFPDNFINVVDETLAGAVFNGVSTVKMNHFNEVLSRLTGQVILCADEELPKRKYKK